MYSNKGNKRKRKRKAYFRKMRKNFTVLSKKMLPKGDLFWPKSINFIRNNFLK